MGRYPCSVAPMAGSSSSPCSRPASARWAARSTSVATDARGRRRGTAGRATGPLAPARSCAFAVVRRVFEQGAYADRALHAGSKGLDARDRALAMALSYGTIQRRRTLDYVISKFSSRPPKKLDPAVLAALRLGLFQLLFLGGVAD